MQVFKTYLKILKKHLHVASIYVIAFLLTGFAMTFMDDSASLFEQTRLKICVLDLDNTPESRALCDLISKQHDIREMPADEDAMLDALYYERINYALTIGKGYAEKLAAGETDGLFENRFLHDSYSTAYMEQFLNEYVCTVRAYLAGGAASADAAAQACASFETETAVRVVKSGPENTSDMSLAAALFFRYLPYLFISVLMNVLCPVLHAVNKKDIRFRTDCSGVRPLRYTAAIFGGTGVFVAGIWVIFVAAAIPMNGGLYHGTAWIAVLNSLVFTLFSASVTLLVSGFDPPSNLVNMITQMISLGMCFICGVFVDQNMLGENVLAAARFLPAYWYIRVNRMMEGSDAFDGALALRAIAIEAAFAAVLALLTVLVRKSRSRSASA